MVFQLKESVGIDVIEEREAQFTDRAVAKWQANPNIEILGNLNSHRLSIVSFVVKYQNRYLHHNFVVSLLNDLFGIQARGGCSCAGPYGHRLLGIDLDTSQSFERAITAGCEGIKPGWVRVNFNYFITEEVFNYILQAVEWVANYGYYFVPRYLFNPYSSLWKHRSKKRHNPNHLTDIAYTNGQLGYNPRWSSAGEDVLQLYLHEADRLLTKVKQFYAQQGFELGDDAIDNQDFETLRWFHLPQEVLHSLRKQTKMPAMDC